MTLLHELDVSQVVDNGPDLYYEVPALTLLEAFRTYRISFELNGQALPQTC